MRCETPGPDRRAVSSVTTRANASTPSARDGAETRRSIAATAAPRRHARPCAEGDRLNRRDEDERAMSMGDRRPAEALKAAPPTGPSLSRYHSRRAVVADDHGEARSTKRALEGR